MVLISLSINLFKSFLVFSLVIEINNLSKSFDKKRMVLDQLTLEIKEKEIFALLGPNGAGKTTLINIVCGLLKKTDGNVKVNGLNPFTHTNEVRAQIGLVPQETALYDYLTAKENLEFHAKFYGMKKSDRGKLVKDALQMAQLEDRKDDRVGTFSGGMKRRLALVRSILHSPSILILDEPTLGIDVQNRNEIWNRIEKLKQNKTIIINTNYMDEADRLADRCAIIDQGKIVALDTPANLKIKYTSGVRVEALIKSDSIEVINEIFHPISDELHIEPRNDEFHVSIPARRKINDLLIEISEIVKGREDELKIIDLTIREPTLADAFLELTGKQLRD